MAGKGDKQRNDEQANLVCHINYKKSERFLLMELIGQKTNKMKIETKP